MTEYDKTLQILNSKLGNTVKLIDKTDDKGKFAFMGFDTNSAVSRLKPYSLHIATFVIVFILLLMFKPNFVLKTTIVSGTMEKQLCMGRVLLWSIVAVVVVVVLEQLYRYKLVKTSKQLFYG